MTRGAWMAMSARKNAERGWASHRVTFEEARDDYMRAADLLAASATSHTDRGMSPADAEASLTAERQAWSRLKFARRRIPILGQRTGWWLILTPLEF